MADAMATRRQDMEEEATDEFLRLQRHGLASGAMTVIPPFERDAFIVSGHKTTVGDSDTMGVTGKIAQHLLGTGKGAFGVNHPIGSARGAQIIAKDDGIHKWSQIAKEFESASLVGGIEQTEKQAAEQTRKHPHG